MRCVRNYRLAWVVRLSVLAGFIGLNPPAASAQSCSQTLSPGANVASAIASAAAGSTICLNSGSYGSVTLSGVSKNPRVTRSSVTSQGATVRLTFDTGAQGITFDGLTVTGAEFSGSTTRKITIQ